MIGKKQKEIGFKMKKLRFGVIGAGGIARTRTIPGIVLAQNAELTAIMDVNEKLLAEMTQQYGVKGYVSADALLADEQIDAVYIASPVFAHLEQVKAAAAAGKHILVEKPAGRTAEECAQMLSACEAAGVQIGVGFMMRFHTYHRQLREIIAKGALGQIVSARAQQVFWYPDIPNCWRQQKALSGGGALMDVGIHNIDVIEYIVNSPVKRITGFTETRTFSYDVDDVCNLLIQLENGTVAYIDGAFNMHAAPGGNLLEVYGTKGTVLIQGSIGQAEAGDPKAFYIDEQGKRQVLPLQDDFGNLYQKEIESFAEAVLTGGAVPVPLTEGMHIQQVAEAAYQAQAEGRVVELKK